MSDDKGNGKSGGWFPNINSLLLILLAGTLFISQTPFHELRPDKTTTPIVNPANAHVHSVDARLWEDPFEAVERYIVKHKDNKEELDGLEIIQTVIEEKLKEEKSAAENLENINVIAVMLPGGSYYEYAEARRKLRYAVLSGFNAALRYMPEDTDHIQFFLYPKDKGNNKNQSQKTNDKKSITELIEVNFGTVNIEKKISIEDQARIAYEWMIYKPKQLSKQESHPPVLLLWLNSNDFSTSTPHKDLVNLILRLDKVTDDVLKELLDIQKGNDNTKIEIEKLIQSLNSNVQKQNKEIEKYLPKNTQKKPDEKNKKIEEKPFKNFLKQIAYIVFDQPDFQHFQNLLDNTSESGKADLTPEEKKHSDDIKKLLTPLADFKPRIGNVSMLGPFDSEGLQNLAKEMFDSKCNSTPDGNCTNSIFENYHYFSPAATMQESNLVKQLNLPDLYSYFHDHALSFLRVIATDQHLAQAIKNELKLRGIEASKENRILLVGEWDSLYTWHLTNTFASELLKGRETDCPDGQEKGKVQDFDKLYDDTQQCIFRVSYQRGLDGEKLKADGSTNKTVSSNKNSSETKGTAENIENASGDSQFDYVRRMAAQIEELDKNIRHADPSNHDIHAIKAIGILGSDVYDKLLIVEALHNKFPDAVFFTNDMDARLLEPINNTWARNMVISSSFDLRLNRYLQKDIPPFRDSTQTAFFLATEMALAKQKQTEMVLEKQLDYDKLPIDELPILYKDDIKRLLLTSKQDELDKLLMPDSTNPARLFEVGRTKVFNLNTDCIAEKDCLHPNTDKKNESNLLGFLITFIGISALIFTPTLRKLLEQKSGLQFVVSIVVICSLLLLISSSSNQAPPISLFIYVALFYAVLILRVAFLDQIQSNNRTKNRTLILSLLSIAIGCWIVWIFVKPQGLFDNKEPYALLEGVSMWPSQAIRLIALILAGYFTIKVFYFPKEFTQWLNKHFVLSNLTSLTTGHISQIRNQYVQSLFSFKIKKAWETARKLWSSSEYHDYILLNKWLNWTSFERRCFYALVWGIVFYIIGNILFLFLGAPQIPYRGENQNVLNALLMQGVLVPAFSLLLWSVTDAVIKTVNLVKQCFTDDLDNNSAKWPLQTLQRYADRFNLSNPEDVREWVGMRFITELTGHIYQLIGYPLIIALLMVIARSSYFDNWQMPMALKLVIGFSMVWLLYWDYCLKKAADKARENALKSLQAKVIKYKGQKEGDQLEQLINMIKNYDVTVYKSFTQRPIFLNSLLILIALLADSADYATLASKFLRGL